MQIYIYILLIHLKPFVVGVRGWEGMQAILDEVPKSVSWILVAVLLPIVPWNWKLKKWTINYALVMKYR